MLGRGQGVLAGDVELVKAHVMEEHIDAAKVVGGDIDLLPEVTELHPVLAQNLGRFQQQRAGAAGRVIDLIDLCFSHCPQPGQQFRHVGGCEELAAALSGVGGIHGHQKFISVAKGIDAVAPDLAQVHAADAIE